jgi:hypothetical protein
MDFSNKRGAHGTASFEAVFSALKANIRHKRCLKNWQAPRRRRSDADESQLVVC